jgi:hypothetical protein
MSLNLSFHLNPALWLDERLFGEFRFAVWTTARLAEDEVERSMLV